MTFDEFKATINTIESCEPVGDWSFDKIITLLGDVELNFDVIVDAEGGQIDNKLSE